MSPFQDNAVSLLHHTEHRLTYLVVFIALLHLFILLSFDFRPFLKPLGPIQDPLNLAVSLTLTQNIPPLEAEYIGLYDYKGHLNDAQPLTQMPETSPTSLPLEEARIIALQENTDAETTQSTELQQLPQPLKVSPPKTRILYASTRQHQDAAYLYRWQQYIEAIGAEHYPQKARQKNLTGFLRLLVALKPDGRVADIQIRQSSGSEILDQAAIDIVKQAEPFEPIPASLLADNEQIEIMRTWEFRGRSTSKS